MSRSAPAAQLTIKHGREVLVLGSWAGFLALASLASLVPPARLAAKETVVEKVQCIPCFPDGLSQAA